MKAAQKKRVFRRWSAVVGVLCALAAGLLSLTPFLERWELRTHDLRFLLRGPRPTNARIVIAPITDRTLQQWPEPKLFWGSHLAAAIRNARAAGATWIGLDHIPAVSVARWDPDPEQELARALNQGKVALAYALFGGSGPQFPAATLRLALPDPRRDLGFIDAPDELDGVVRHGLVYQEDERNGRLVASLPAVLLLRARGQSPTDAQALRALTRASTPEAQAGTVWINYLGPTEELRYVSLEKLASGRLSQAERASIRDAVVMIGPRYKGDNDTSRGPYGDGYHGVEILANTLATLWDGRPLRRWPRADEALIAAVLGSLIALTVASLSPGGSTAIACAAAGAWCLASQRAFNADLLLPTAGPLLSIGLTWIGETSARAVVETRRRRWVQSVFGRYVSRELVQRSRISADRGSPLIRESCVSLQLPGIPPSPAIRER